MSDSTIIENAKKVLLLAYPELNMDKLAIAVDLDIKNLPIVKFWKKNSDSYKRLGKKMATPWREVLYFNLKNPYYDVRKKRTIVKFSITEKELIRDLKIKMITK